MNRSLVFDLASIVIAGADVAPAYAAGTPAPTAKPSTTASAMPSTTAKATRARPRPRPEAPRPDLGQSGRALGPRSSAVMTIKGQPGLAVGGMIQPQNAGSESDGSDDQMVGAFGKIGPDGVARLTFAAPQVGWLSGTTYYFQGYVTDQSVDNGGARGTFTTASWGGKASAAKASTLTAPTCRTAPVRLRVNDPRQLEGTDSASSATVRTVPSRHRRFARDPSVGRSR